MAETIDLDQLLALTKAPVLQESGQLLTSNLRKIFALP